MLTVTYEGGAINNVELIELNHADSNTHSLLYPPWRRQPSQSVPQVQPLGSVSRSSDGGEIQLDMETVGRLMSLLLGLKVN